MGLVFRYGSEEVVDTLLTCSNGTINGRLLFMRALVNQIEIFDGFEAISEAIYLGQQLSVIICSSLRILDCFNRVFDKFEACDQIANRESKAYRHVCSKWGVAGVALNGAMLEGSGGRIIPIVVDEVRGACLYRWLVETTRKYRLPSTC